MADEQEVARMLMIIHKIERWRAAGLCGCCGKQPLIDGRCADSHHHRAVFQHVGRSYRKRADAKGPPCTLSVGKDTWQWNTSGNGPWGNQGVAFWDDIIEECVPEADGAFVARAGMERTWTGSALSP